MDSSSAPSYNAFDTTSRRLVVAIDFGVTFTRVAYLFYVPQFGNQPYRISQEISLVRRWNNLNNDTDDKTPSIIAYHTQPPTWGANVSPTDHPQAKYFKLGLEPKAQEQYKGSLARMTFDEARRGTRAANKQPEDLMADYLALLLQHGETSEILGDISNNHQVHYVITVPALWSDLAIERTKLAAARAGIPLNQLQLIREPEAAALYCTIMGPDVYFQPNEKFMVCDAGGGRVVILHSNISHCRTLLLTVCATFLNLGLNSGLPVPVLPAALFFSMKALRI